jgi:hypothetical protein
MIVDTPLVTHDVWLQALTENGAIGLALLIGAFGACILASLAAARRFVRAGRPDLAHLARAVAVAQVGSLAASTFIANGNDRVWWVLLSLGPVLLAVDLATSSSAADDADANAPALPFAVPPVAPATPRIPAAPAAPVVSPATSSPSFPDPSR